VLLAMAVVTAAMVGGVSDRSAGNADEQVYLSFERAGLDVAVSRRGPVCTVPPYPLAPAPAAPPESMEIVQETTGDSRPLPAFVPLAWGLSRLRLGDWDYRVVQLGDLPVVEVTPRGETPVAAVVSARRDRSDTGKGERLMVSIRWTDRSSELKLTWKPVGAEALFAGRMTACPAIIGSRTPWAAAGFALGFMDATERHPDTGFATTVAAFQGPLTRAGARVVAGSASVKPCPPGVEIDRGFWTPELRVETRNGMAPLGRPMPLGGRVILLPKSAAIGNQFAALHCGSAAYHFVDWGRVDDLGYSDHVGLRVHALNPATGSLVWSRYVDVAAVTRAYGRVTSEDGRWQLPAIAGVAEEADDLVVTFAGREPGTVPVSVAIRRPVPGSD
jgi:hypothetical protein